MCVQHISGGCSLTHGLQEHFLRCRMRCGALCFLELAALGEAHSLSSVGHAKGQRALHSTQMVACSEGEQLLLSGCFALDAPQLMKASERGVWRGVQADGAQLSVHALMALAPCTLLQLHPQLL